MHTALMAEADSCLIQLGHIHAENAALSFSVLYSRAIVHSITYAYAAPCDHDCCSVLWLLNHRRAPDIFSPCPRISAMFLVMTVATS